MDEFKSDNSVSRVVKNGMFTVLSFVVFSLSGFFLIPFLVKQYGSGSYGLIALAGFLTQYVGMISGAVGGAVARYINVALNKNDWEQASEIFSTALVANIGLIILQIPFYTLGLWKLNWLINFPDAVSSDFRILVLCNILIFFISTVTGIIYTPLMAANRLDISPKIGLIQGLLRVFLLFTLITLLGGKLWVIGAVDLALCILNATFGYVVILKRMTKSLCFNWDSVSLKWAKPILSMAGWSLVSILGFALFVQTDIWMINRFVSAEMAGVYAALLLWPNLVKRIGGIFGNLVAPVFTIDFARGNLDRMRNTCILTGQLLSYGAAYGCAVFVVAAPWLIRLWLGDGYEGYSLWAQLMIGVLVFTISGSINWHIFVSIGKTKYMGLGNIIPGILNIVLSLSLIGCGYGAIGVLIGTIISILLKENILFPIWISKETGIAYRSFLMIYLRSGVVFGAVLGAGKLVWNQSSPFSWSSFILMAFMGAIISFVLVVILSRRSERSSMVLFIKNKYEARRVRL